MKNAIYGPTLTHYVIKNYNFELKITMCKNKTKFLTYNAKIMKIRNRTFISDTVCTFTTLFIYHYNIIMDVFYGTKASNL